jgi:hypothetical protein
MKYKLFIFIVFFCSANQALALRCFKPSDWEQEVSDLIEVGHFERSNDYMVEVSLAMPEKYQGYEISLLSITRKPNNLEYSAIVYPYKLVENGLVKSSLFVKKNELKNWSATVIYAEPQEENIVKEDGCIVKSTTNLKHNKVKNENASEAGSGASSTRPF